MTNLNITNPLNFASMKIILLPIICSMSQLILVNHQIIIYQINNPYLTQSQQQNPTYQKIDHILLNSLLNIYSKQQIQILNQNNNQQINKSIISIQF